MPEGDSITGPHGIHGLGIRGTEIDLTTALDQARLEVARRSISTPYIHLRTASTQQTNRDQGEEPDMHQAKRPSRRQAREHSNRSRFLRCLAPFLSSLRKGCGSVPLGRSPQDIRFAWGQPLILRRETRSQGCRSWGFLLHSRATPTQGRGGAQTPVLVPLVGNACDHASRAWPICLAHAQRCFCRFVPGWNAPLPHGACLLYTPSGAGLSIPAGHRRTAQKYLATKSVALTTRARWRQRRPWPGS